MTAPANSYARAYRLIMRQLAKQQRSAQTAQQAAVLARKNAQIALSARSEIKVETLGEQKTEAKESAKEDVAEPKVPLNTQALRNMGKNIRSAPSSAEYLRETAAFLANQREYLQLLERYGSGPEDTPERVRKTARRVGLDTDLL